MNSGHFWIAALVATTGTACSSPSVPAADPGVKSVPMGGNRGSSPVGGSEMSKGDGGVCTGLMTTLSVQSTTRPPPRPDGLGGVLLEGTYRVVSVGEYTSSFPTIPGSNERLSFIGGRFEQVLGTVSTSGTYEIVPADAGTNPTIVFSQTCPFVGLGSMEYTTSSGELLLYPTSIREVVYRRE